MSTITLHRWDALEARVESVDFRATPHRIYHPSFGPTLMGSTVGQKRVFWWERSELERNGSLGDEWYPSPEQAVQAALARAEERAEKYQRLLEAARSNIRSLSMWLDRGEKVGNQEWQRGESA